MSEYAAKLVESTVTSGITRLAQLTPATPIALFVAAAAAPETAVPWPVTSEVSPLHFVKFHPGTSFAARSGWVESTPESMTAMITDAEPVVRDHASPLPILGRCHC